MVLLSQEPQEPQRCVSSMALQIFSWASATTASKRRRMESSGSESLHIDVYLEAWRGRIPKHKTCHFPKGPTDSYRFLQILQVLIRFEFEILEKCETIDFVMNSNMNLFVFAEQPGLICTRLGPFTAALPRLCTDQEHAAATAKPRWAVKVDRSPR